MEQTKENNYRFNATDYLRQLDTDEEFYCIEKTEVEDGTPEIYYEHLTVNNVWVTQAWSSYQMHVDVDYMSRPGTWTHDIKKEQYIKFVNYKGDMRRLKLFLKVFADTIVKRKGVASKHIDLRVTPELYKTLDDGAKECKKTLSRYCREILKGKTPKAALSDEQLEMMKRLLILQRDLENFRSAMIAQLKKMPPEERTTYMVDGLSMAEWRKYLKDSIAILNNTFFKDI